MPLEPGTLNVNVSYQKNTDPSFVIFIQYVILELGIILYFNLYLPD